jgi:methyl-accepting chemotaxis protein
MALRLRARVAILLCAIVVPIILGGMVAVSVKVYRDIRISESGRFRENARTAAADLAGDLSSAIGLCRSLRAAVEESRRAGRTDRVFLPILFGRLMADAPDLQAIWANFEPNAWDGRDRDFVGREGYLEDDGAFAPWAYRDDAGAVAVEVAAWGESGYTADYYALPKQRGRLTVLEPYADTDTAETLMTSVAAPLFDADGKFFGVAGVDVSLAQIERRIAELSAVHSGWSCLVSSGGLVVGHSEPDLRLKPFAETEDAVLVDRLLNADFAAGGGGFVPISAILDSRLTGGRVFAVAVPIDLGESGVWRYISTIVLSELDRQSWEAIAWMVTVTVGLVLLLLFAAFLVAGMIVKPIDVVAASLSRVASGDFTVAVPELAGSELGTLARSFNALSRSLAESFAEIRASVTGIEEMGAELAASNSEAGAAVSTIVGRIDQGREAFASKAKLFDSSTAAIRLVLASVAALDAKIQEQADTIGRSAGETAQLIRGVGQTAAALDDLDDRFRRLVAASDAGMQRVESLLARVADALKQSKGLHDTNEAVSAIAESTNMLAMNAAIEAAHAGEVGKGFAVVAGEIGKLAEDSGERSEEIDNLIGTVQAAVLAIRDEAAATMTAFEAVHRQLDEAADYGAAARADTERQRQEGERLSGYLERTTEGGVRLRRDAASIRVAGSAVSEAIDALALAEQSWRGVMEAVGAEAETISRAAAAVSAVVAANREATLKTGASLNRFHTGGRSS